MATARRLRVARVCAQRSDVTGATHAFFERRAPRAVSPARRQWFDDLITELTRVAIRAFARTREGITTTVVAAVARVTRISTELTFAYALHAAVDARARTSIAIARRARILLAQSRRGVQRVARVTRTLRGHRVARAVPAANLRADDERAGARHVAIRPSPASHTHARASVVDATRAHHRLRTVRLEHGVR